MEENKSSIGSIVGTIVIIALIILGGLYFWGKRIEESKTAQNLVGGGSEPTADISEAATIKSMSSSDDLGSIEAELSSTNTTNLSPEAE